jgi:Amt family ammonium transporter
MRVALLTSLVFLLLLGTLAQPAWAADGAATKPSLDTGDTAWMLTSSVLVLMMTIPGLALFYGGLVRNKNVLSTLMHSLFCAALISVTWVLFGYSLSFVGAGSLWGNLSQWGLGFPMNKSILGTTHPLAPSIPTMLFVMYQATFAIITPALISGTFAERMRFPAFALFMLLWSTFIYTPLCHWVWGGGWMGPGDGNLKALDFAGGTVVHISSGISALVTAIYLGKRFGYGHEPMPPHNLPFTVIGASLLWVGWFGFNAGSALGSNELASIAFLNTNTAAAAAAIAWLCAEWVKSGKPTILGAASGAVAGLVAITPAAGFVNPMAAIFIGLAGGVVCYTAVSLKPKFGYDDALDVVGVHMVGGTLGALLTGVFASLAVNAAGADGGTGQLLRQTVAVVVTYIFCGVGTFILLVIVNAITRVRADQQEEIIGLDLSQHSERAYVLSPGENLALAHEPKPATVPPARPGKRYTLVLNGIDADVMSTRWRTLCQNGSTEHPPEFAAIYGQVSTVRGNRFNFRGGDPRHMKKSLEDVFKPVAKEVSASIEEAVSKA